MNDDLRAELLERAGRDQAARGSLPPGHGIEQWQESVESAEGLAGRNPDDQQPGAPEQGHGG